METKQKYTLGETLIYVEDLSVSYDGGETFVIKDFNMVEKDVIIEGQNTGQVIAILGRSGRGKSTLFKVMTGLLKPTGGRVLISDGNGGAKTVSEGNVGFVDQKYTLFRHKTVFNILKYALRKSDLSSDEKDKLIEEYLTNWGLIKQRDQYPCELSGGQKQRTAIIEQILSSGKYIVFDEPASGLDVGNIEKLKKSFYMIGANDDLNTIIFSTHDINLAVELADSIYVIGHPNSESQHSTNVAHYDLKEMGLAWRPFGEKHLELVEEIKDVMLKS